MKPISHSNFLENSKMKIRRIIIKQKIINKIKQKGEKERSKSGHLTRGENKSNRQ